MKKWVLIFLCIAMLLILAVPGFAETPPTAPTIVTQPVDLSLTYGYTDGNVLSVSASAADGYTLSYQWYSNTNAGNEGGMPIDGATEASYAVPDSKNAGTTEYYYCVVTATRTDNGQTAETVSNASTVSIGKATPNVAAPTASATYGETLFNISLTNPESNIPGEWSWMEDYASNINEEYIPDAGEYTFKAKFTPDDTVNYNETTKDASVTVTKADLIITIKDNSEIYGEPRDVVVRCNEDYDGEVTILVGDEETTATAKDGVVTVGHALMNVGKYDIKALATATDNYKSREETLIHGLEIRPVPNPAFIQPAVNIQRGTSYDLSQLVSVENGTVSFALVGTPDGYSFSGENNKTLTLDNNAASSCTIKVTVDGGNYESAEGEITVTAADLLRQEHFKFDDLSLEKTYGDEDFTVAATGAVDGSSVTYSSSDPTVATVEAATGKVHILKVGEATITAIAGATDYHAQATACCWLTVNRKPVTISGVTAEDMEYDGPPEIPLNTSGAVIAGKLDEDDLTVSARGAIINLNVGESPVKISYTLGGAAAGNYTLAKEGQQETTTVKILPKYVTVSGITAVNKTYDGTTEATLDYTNVSIKDEKDESVFGDLTVTATGAFADKNVGDNKTVTISDLKLVGEEAKNYRLVESGQQTTASASITAKEVGLIWTNTRLTYTGEAQKPTVTVTGLVEGEACTVTVTGEQTNAGADYTATAGGLSSNYKLPENKTVTFKISKATPDITVEPTASAIIYGQTLADSNLSGEAGGVAGNFVWKDQTVAPVVSDSQTTEYDVVFTPTDTANYYEVERKLKLTVEQKEVGLTWSGTPLTYNGSAQAPTAEATGLVNNDKISVTVIGAQTNAGTGYTATASNMTGDKVGNYKLPAANTLTFSIGKAPLTVTANPKTITYGDAPANDGVQYSGFVNSETESVLGGTLAYAYSYAQYGDVGNNYTITPSGLTADNYDIRFVDGTLTVGQKEVGLTWSETPLTYDGTAQAPTATATGLVNNDEIGVTISGAQTNAGTGYTATASGLTGDKAGNYKLPEAKTTTFAIGKVPLTVTAKNHSVTYGDAPANDGVQYSGFVHGETESVLSGTLAYDYSYAQYGDVGNNYTITPSGLTSGNYDISFAAGTLTVGQKEVGLTWNASLTYNGSAQAPTATATGLVNNDKISVSVSGAQTNAGTGYTATASGLTGDKAGNYKLPDAKTTTFAIGKAPLTVTANPKTITYGDAPVSNGVVYSGFVNSETESVLSGTLAYDYSYTQYGNAGSDWTITPKGLTGSNYTISFVPGKLTVLQKEVGLSWNTAPLTYSGTAQAPAATATGLVNGDAVSVTVSGAQTNAGTGYTATASALTGDKAGNYKLPATGLTQEFSIGKAAAQTIADETDTLVFTLTSVSKSVAGKMPADAGELTYTKGNASTTGSVTVSDFTVNATSGAVTATLSGGAAGDTVTLPVTIGSVNYADSTVNAVITLIPKEDAGVSISGAPASAKTYGDAAFTLTGSVTNAGTGTGTWTWSTSDPTVFQITPNGATATVKILKAGSATVSAKYESLTALDTETTALITVNTKPLTIAAKNQSINVGRTVPTLDGADFYTVTGLVGTDTLTTEPTLAYQKNGSAVTPDNSTAGTYDIAVYGAAASENYTISYVNGTLTISDKYTVRYDANGGTNAPAAQTKEYGVTLRLSTQKPSRADYVHNYVTTLIPNGGTLEGESTLHSAQTTVYTFQNWNSSPVGSNTSYAPGASYTENASVTLYAQWTSVSTRSKVMLPVPVREGYTFNGWNIHADAERGAMGEYEPTGTRTLYATWKLKQSTITFDTDGGTKIAPITQDYGTAITAPADPTREGYTFAGWDKPIPATMPAEDMTITAQWTADRHTITFDTDGGTEIAPITQDYGTAISTPADPTREGYTFAGWDKPIPATMPAEDMTIKASWTINRYTITFDTDGGTEIAPITQDYGTAITAPADPTRTGYIFAGWDKAIPATMPAEDMTIKASWTNNRYTITFDTAGGTKIAPITQDYGTAITAPADPTKEGYTFAGWNKAIPATMPAEDMTVKASWTINRYTITFDTDGGTEIAPITQDYGTAITAPADPTREGYTFAGWDKAIPATMPAEDMTITAQWTADRHTITFDTAGGTEIAPITQDYGTAITAPADPTRTGYTFAGWDKAIPATMPAEDMTIKAKWTAKAPPEADFILPAALVTIEESAFEGVDAACVQITGNVSTIGPRAFADCMRLTALVVPASVQHIDDTALEGSANAVVYGASGSEAQRFAEANGIPFVPMNQN